MLFKTWKQKDEAEKVKRYMEEEVSLRGGPGSAVAWVLTKRYMITLSDMAQQTLINRSKQEK
jgi:hypothetical protein